MEWVPERVLRQALAALGAALFALAARAQSEPAVRFLAPRDQATVLGESKIVVEVTVPDGTRLHHVELKVDGKLLRALTAPPWEASWDAGDRGRGHTLEAVLRLTDGREAHARIETSKLRIDDVARVELVDLYVVARDRDGRHVTDLRREEVTVLEDGRPQAIERFTTAHQPLRVALVLDSSSSMRDESRLEKAKKAAVEFVRILEPGDEATVVLFDDYVHLRPEFSSDPEKLEAAIQEAVAHGGTALYDAVWKSARLLEGFDGRRVMVLLSDGRDEASNGLESGSLHSLDEAREQAWRSEVMIFTIGLGDDLELHFVRRFGPLGGASNLDTETSLAELLRDLAEATGGQAVRSSGGGALREAFAKIADDLRHQYSIAYRSSNPTEDGGWRRIEIATTRKGLELSTRKGYYSRKSKH